MRLSGLSSGPHLLVPCQGSASSGHSHSHILSEILQSSAALMSGSPATKKIGQERSSQLDAGRPLKELQPRSDTTEASLCPTSSGSVFFLQALKSSLQIRKHGSSHDLQAKPNAEPTTYSRPPPGNAHEPDLPASSAPAVTAFSATLSTAISLSFYGETITFDLKSLEQDAQPIIELLKLTESGCGNWMTVGAYYRRSGNIRAAISVVEAMINVMLEQGLLEKDLKPAFLLLSTCEMDLAKRATEPGTTGKHTQAAHSWLQRVYGKLDAVGCEVGPTVVTPPPRQTRTKSIVHVSSSRPPTSPLPTAREKILQREIKSLTDSRNEQETMMCSLKRKYEDQIAFERDGRRRLMRNVEDLEKELKNAKKSEDFALSQVKREVETRRKAEESVRVERTRRLELQKDLEEQRSGISSIADDSKSS